MAQALPEALVVIPVYAMYRNLGLSDSLPALSLVDAAFILPICIWILKNSFDSIAEEIYEAALIDGASRVGIFWWLALPLSIPGLVTVGVLAFVASWNAYLLPLLLLQEDMRTLPLGVADYSTEHSADTAGVLAFTTIAMIPALVMFLAMQRRIVSGLVKA